MDYQIPVNPRRINLVMWHSAAATAWLNSAGGMRALLTALKTNNIAGIVMYENVGYLYPQGEGPRGPVTGFGPIEVPLEEFKKLTKIPLQVVWRDNVDKSANYSNNSKAICPPGRQRGTLARLWRGSQ